VTERSLDIVVLGLSITSSWGNGHATTYRSLLQGLHELGHRILFLERDQPWYAEHRDQSTLDYARVALYGSLSELKRRHANAVRNADLVIVGSYVPDGIEVGQWVTRIAKGLTAFYDIDTPITLASLASGAESYISRALVPRYGLYLSFTGGPTLEVIERTYGAAHARALYCAVDPLLYTPAPYAMRWDLAYMGTYSDDRQPSLENLLLAAARSDEAYRFAVVGPQYPTTIAWPSNVERIDHLAPGEHRAFYNRQRFTLNLTRERMRLLGHSPSVRLFEAAACGTPIISDPWPGLETLFIPNREVLIAESTRDVEQYLRDIPEHEREQLGRRARKRILLSHTSTQRAQELVRYVREARTGSLMTNLVEA
jgi:spore maturation protein CgeB